MNFYRKGHHLIYILKVLKIINLIINKIYIIMNLFKPFSPMSKILLKQFSSMTTYQKIFIADKILMEPF